MEDWKKQLLSTAENIRKWTNPVFDNLRRFLASETFSKLAEFLNNLPDDIQKSKLFKKVSKLEHKKISHNDIKWIQDYMECSTPEVSLSKLRDKAKKTHLDNYIISIINANNISSREKLVVLLAHFEAIIYQAITSSRKQNSKIKNEISMRIKKSHGIGIEKFNEILIAGIVFIVFSNTDKYKNINKNIPFRNNILHRGTLDYTNNEVENAYKLLICFIAELITINK